MISYQFLHLTIIQGYSKLSLLDKGFPKGGGPTFGKNSQIISFFCLAAYLNCSRCEVSSEAPHFDTAVKAVHANVSGIMQCTNIYYICASLSNNI